MVSHTIQDAVLRNLQVIAESTQRLSEEIKATQPEIEWRRIAAFRNVLEMNLFRLPRPFFIRFIQFRTWRRKTGVLFHKGT